MTWSARLGIASLAAVVLTACASPGNPASEPTGTSNEVPGAANPVDTPGADTPGSGVSAFRSPAAAGEVMGQGTVLQVGDAPPEFCLGGVRESYPPQCDGPVIADWDWTLAEQSETASGVTWGTYAVTGTWDGSVFTRTGRPTPLSLYDGMPFEDPVAGRQGTNDQQELERIQRQIYFDYQGFTATAGIENGFVIVTVIYDDGTFQARMDGEYGADVVVVLSALQAVP